MRFRILGPMRVWDGTAWAAIKAAQQRQVLAILLIEAGRAVTTDRLIDELWGDRPPAAAVGTIQGYILRLRRLLDDSQHRQLVTRGRGYQLTIEPDALDALVFERRVERGRQFLAEADPQAAAAELSEGLALWRGGPFADVSGSALVTAEATRLEQIRLSALEDHLGAQLDLGRHGSAVDELARLAREYPLREQLWGHLLLALHRCGRRAEALDAYQEARHFLVDELGIEPGQALRDLQLAILNEDGRLSAPPPPRSKAPGVVTPAQIPASAPGFTGRHGYLSQLDALIAPEGAGIAVITGIAGAGKTALGVHWAHRVLEHFPDGQLYVNLRGYSHGVTPSSLDVLARFLRAFGVPGKEIPAEVDEAAALYRTLLAGRRVLVFLDNATSAAQVRPLVPGEAGCLVLVTSRDQLSGLVAIDGAKRLTLGVLDRAEARALLMNLARLDNAAAGTLAMLCGDLPLALRIAAAKLTSQPELSVAEFAKAMQSGGRLDILAVQGDPEATVRAAFDLSYRTLPAASQRLFRLLGLVPGPYVPTAAAAALASAPEADVSRMLAGLASAHLVEQPVAGQYFLHDLLRDYAAEHVTTEESGALQQLYAYYVGCAAAAAEQMYPFMVRLPSTVDGQPFATADDAAAWLDAERPNLVAVVSNAAVSGPFDVAWRLADILRGYFYIRMHTPDWRIVAEAGLLAAQADQDKAGQAAAHSALATLHFAQGRHREAIEQYSAALALASEIGWAAGESAALGNLGNLLWASGRLSEAASHYREAIDRHVLTGMVANQATALGNLGLVYFGQGDLQAAEEHYDQALDLHRKAGAASGEARTLTYLGEVYRAQGRLDESAVTLEKALTMVRAIGDRNSEGDTVRALAATYRETGRHTHALDLASSAVELARSTGDSRLEAGALTTRATVHVAIGQFTVAIEGFQTALRITRAIGNPYLETEALIGLSMAQQRTGRPGGASARAAFELATRGGYALLAEQAKGVTA